MKNICTLINKIENTRIENMNEFQKIFHFLLEKKKIINPIEQQLRYFLKRMNKIGAINQGEESRFLENGKLEIAGTIRSPISSHAYKRLRRNLVTE